MVKRASGQGNRNGNVANQDNVVAPARNAQYAGRRNTKRKK